VIQCRRQVYVTLLGLVDIRRSRDLRWSDAGSPATADPFIQGYRCPGRPDARHLVRGERGDRGQWSVD
jgi:hypothetical protein